MAMQHRKLRNQPEKVVATPAMSNEYIDRLMKQGYFVLKGALDADQISRAQAALPKASNSVWQRRSHRIFDVIELDSVFAEALEQLPSEVLQAVLGPDFHCGSYHALSLHPEHSPLSDSERAKLRAAELHTDYPYGHTTTYFGGNTCVRPKQFPWTVQALWMLTEFTPRNGATMLLPESHKIDDESGSGYCIPSRGDQDSADFKTFMKDAVTITGKAGDLVIYLGQAWHTISLNEETNVRTALLGQFLPYYFKPMESHAWTLSPRLQGRLKPDVCRLLGINWFHPFMHSTRPGPPRTPLKGVSFCIDSLFRGYPPAVPPELVKVGLHQMVEATPSLRHVKPVMERLSLLPWKLYRLISCLALAAIPLLSYIFPISGDTSTPYLAPMFNFALLFLGFLLGTLTTLERLHM